MSTRISCCVPGCRRTTAKRFEEWICGKHWRLTPETSRRAMSEIARKYRRQFGENGWWTFPAGSDSRLAAVALDRDWWAAWENIKRIAIERNFTEVM